ncbi:MAG: CHAT domain-containing tetratricopeptide repeat protein [Bacteroidota bacterium]
MLKKIGRTLLGTAIFLSIYSVSFSQQSIDSLETRLANTTSDSLKIRILDRLIPQYFYTEKRERTWELIDLLKRLSESENEQLGVLRAHLLRGWVHFNLDYNTDDGLKYYHKALNHGLNNGVDHPGMYSSIYSQIGLIHKNLEAFDSAIYYYEKGLVIDKENELEGRQIISFINLSRLNGALGNHHRSIEYANKIVDFGKNFDDKEAVFAGYRRLGVAYTESEAFESANEYLEKALALAEELYDQGAPDISYIYKLLGTSLMGLKDYNSALLYEKKYLKYLVGLHGEGHPKLASTHYLLGRIYQEKAVYDSAVSSYSKALEYGEKNSDSFNRGEFDIYGQLGKLYTTTGDYDTALSHYNRALKLFAADSTRNSMILHLIGKVHFKKKDYQRSLEYYNQALDIVSGQASEHGNPNSAGIRKKSQTLLILSGKSQVHYAIWEKGKLENVEELRKALSSFYLYDTIITGMQDIYKVDKDALNFNESKQDVYEMAVKVCYELYQATQDKSYMSTAFYFAEKSKASVLHKAISDQFAINYSGISDSLINKGEELKSRINFYQAKLDRIADKGGSSDISDFNDRLFSLKYEYNLYTTNLEKDFPEYYDIKYNRQQLSLEALLENLDDQTLIEYVNTSGSDLYAFVLSEDSQSFIKLKKPQNFDESVIEFKDLLLEQDNDKYQRLGFQLYQSLFASLSDQIKNPNELIIIPDGNLWHINFDLLLSKQPAGRNYSQFPYLLRSYAISYAHSANLLFRSYNTSSKGVLKECLAFSFTDSSDINFSQSLSFRQVRDAKVDLPGSRAEIKNIARQIPGRYHFGAAASEKNFKEDASKYSMLHLALHGQIEDADPSKSKLYFSPVREDTLEDNYLHIYELYNMKLYADMVVLSACNTGAGTLHRGEGIVSLGRAFQYAGVKSIVLSDWEVVDDTAPLLMEYFYGNLKRGMTKSEALRQAKLKYLGDDHPYSSAPFYWGNFRLIGDLSRLNFSQNYSYVLVTTVVLLAVFLVLLVGVEGRKIKT